jgi:diacylglycerol kinase (ATP)
LRTAELAPAVARSGDPEGGMLCIVIIRPMSKPDLVRTCRKLHTGGHTEHHQYEHHRARSVTVAAPGVVAYADGERLGVLRPTVALVPGALRVLAPR